MPHRDHSGVCWVGIRVVINKCVFVLPHCCCCCCTPIHCCCATIHCCCTTIHYLCTTRHCFSTISESHLSGHRCRSGEVIVMADYLHRCPPHTMTVENDTFSRHSIPGAPICCPRRKWAWPQTMWREIVYQWTIGLVSRHSVIHFSHVAHYDFIYCTSE